MRTPRCSRSHPLRTRRAAGVVLAAAVATFTSGCRGAPVYDFGAIEASPDAAPSAERSISVPRFMTRLFADVLGRRPGSLDLTIDCDAVERVVPGFRDSTCGGRASITFPIDEREVIENALSSVAEPSALWPHLIAVFAAGSYAQVPRPTEWQGREGALVDHLFVRYLDRAPNAYERHTLSRALREDPAMTPRALLIGILSSEEYRRR